MKQALSFLFEVQTILHFQDIKIKTGKNKLVEIRCTGCDENKILPRTHRIIYQQNWNYDRKFNLFISFYTKVIASIDKIK